jgi:hypothetical protein
MPMRATVSDQPATADAKPKSHAHAA